MSVNKIQWKEIENRHVSSTGNENYFRNSDFQSFYADKKVNMIFSFSNLKVKMSNDCGELVILRNVLESRK